MCLLQRFRGLREKVLLFCRPLLAGLSLLRTLKFLSLDRSIKPRSFRLKLLQQANNVISAVDQQIIYVSNCNYKWPHHCNTKHVHQKWICTGHPCLNYSLIPFMFFIDSSILSGHCTAGERMTESLKPAQVCSQTSGMLPLPSYIIDLLE